MAYINVADWKSEHVSDWVKGLGDGFDCYGVAFDKKNVDGKKLLLLTTSDLPDYSVHKIGHQEIILEGIELLRSFHYDLENENLQQLALMLSCKSRSLNRELSDLNYELKPNKGDKVPTATIASVAEILVSVKAMLSWLNRYPFYGQDQYTPIKTRVLQLGMELATNAQRDSFAENPVDVIRERCHELSCLCDAIIQDFSDPLVIQPASLDVITIKQNPDCQLDIIQQSAYSGIHIIGEIKYNNLTYIGGKIEEGDEIVQINYQTVIGWQHKNLQQLMQKASSDIILTLKKRPRHSSRSCQVYIKPLRLPSRKLTLFTSPVGPSSWMSSSIPLSYSTRHYVSKFPSPLPLKNICISAKKGPTQVSSKSSLSSSSDSEKESPEAVTCIVHSPSTEIFDDVTEVEVDDDDAFLPAGENMSPVSLRLDFARKTNIRRRATVTGASPTNKRPLIDLDQLWQHLKKEKSSEVSQPTNNVNTQEDHSKIVNSPIVELPKPALKPKLNKSVSVPSNVPMTIDHSRTVDELPLNTIVEDSGSPEKESSPESTKITKSCNSVVLGETDENTVIIKDDMKPVDDEPITQAPIRLTVGHQNTPNPPTRYSVGTSVRAMEPCDHQGWLLRRHDGKGLLANKWAKKWFVLKNHTLYGFRDYESSRPESFMGLPGFKVSLAPEVKTKKFTFKVYSSGKTVFFACDSTIDMGQWMNKISSAANLSPSNVTSCPPSQPETNVGPTRGNDSLKRKGSFLSRKKASLSSSNNDSSVTNSKVDKVKGVIIPTHKYQSYRRVPSESTPDLVKTTERLSNVDNEMNRNQVNSLNRKPRVRDLSENSHTNRRTLSGTSRRGSMDSTSSDKVTLRRRYSSAFIDSKNKENSDKQFNTPRLCRLHSCEAVKTGITEFKDRMPVKSYSSPKLHDKGPGLRRPSSALGTRKSQDPKRGSLSPTITQSVERLSDVSRKSTGRKRSGQSSICSSCNSIGSCRRLSRESLASSPTDNRTILAGFGTSVSSHDLRHVIDTRHICSLHPSGSEMSVLDRSDLSRHHRSPSVSSMVSSSKRSSLSPRSPDPCLDGSPEKLWLNSLRSDSKPKSMSDFRSKSCHDRRTFQLGKRPSELSLRKSSTYEPPQPMKAVNGANKMKLAFEMNLDAQMTSDPKITPTRSNKPFKFFSSPGLSRKSSGSIVRREKRNESGGDLSPRTLLGSPRLHKAIFGHQPKKKEMTAKNELPNEPQILRNGSFGSTHSRSSETISRPSRRDHTEHSSSPRVTQSQTDLPSVPSMSPHNVPEMGRTMLKPTMGVSMIGKPKRHDIVSPPSSPLKNNVYSSHPNSPAYYYSELGHHFNYNFTPSPSETSKPYPSTPVGSTNLSEELEYPPVFVPETYSLPAAAKLAASLQLARANDPRLKAFDVRSDCPWIKSVNCVATQTDGDFPSCQGEIPDSQNHKTSKTGVFDGVSIKVGSPGTKLDSKTEKVPEESAV